MAAVNTWFDADQLIADAVAAAGADDFGSDSFREGLERLLASLSAEGRLNDIGRHMVPADVVEYLATRLQIEQWRATHADVAAHEVGAPIVIMGQGRTGTTILYDLLAQDPALRAPRTWEVDKPIPPPERATYDTDPRIDEVQARIDLTDQLIPGFTAFHPIGARFAQECVRITGGDFRSMIFPTQYRVPSYAAWLLHEADMAPAYRYHRRFLEHLQSRYRGDRWLLKSPGHIWCLDALLAEYPDALLVQTHRDPVRIIASVSALVAHLRRIASDDPNVPEAAAEFSEYILLGLDRSVDARERRLVAPDRVVDVQFAAFMADPFATIRQVYDQLGMELTPDVEIRMQKFLADHPGDVGGGRYFFADTGLDLGELRDRARRYQRFFDVPDEPLV